MAAPAPAPQTGRLRGVEPDAFTGDRTKTRRFKQQFKVYWNLNDNHEVMQTPYYRVMQALSLIKGPLVDDWKDDQIDTLVEKTSRTVQPVGKDNPALWNDFQTAFDTAFSDTTSKQKAHAAIQTLEMQGQDLDGYIATFKHLAREAGYTLDAEGTIQLFAHGLPKGLASAILHRDTQPTTMDEWISFAQSELQKFARRQAFINPRYMKYQWVRPAPDKRNGHRRRHPNDEVVPMDVDPPVHVNLRRARTEADKDRLRLKGQCFHCERQGHMSRDCPQKKKQFSRPDQSRSRSNQGRPGYGQSPSGSSQGFQKKFFSSPKPTQGYRKSNRQRQYTPRVRAATIEEVEEDDYQDDYYEEEEEVQSLAVRTAKLSDEQKERWVSEMQDVGINFQ
jgi:Retrotransposon gag protein/Zinc knuckle